LHFAANSSAENHSSRFEVGSGMEVIEREENAPEKKIHEVAVP
jgi:hypothetical protein